MMSSEIDKKEDKRTIIEANKINYGWGSIYFEKGELTVVI